MEAAEQRSVVRAWIALGTNLGDRDAALALALRALDERDDTAVVDCSGIYETDPVGPGEQDAYLNAVVELATQLGADALLDWLQAIEARAGRTRRPGDARWGPRVLDLDVLLCGECGEIRLETPRLAVPHPRLAERSFVLVPLVEIAGDLVHPDRDLPVRSLLETLPGVREGGLPAGVRHWEPCRRIAS